MTPHRNTYYLEAHKSSEEQRKQYIHTYAEGEIGFISSSTILKCKKKKINC